MHDENKMHGAEAVCQLMKMLVRAQSEEEFDALRTAIRALVRRRVYRAKGKLNRKAKAASASVQAELF